MTELCKFQIVFGQTFRLNCIRLNISKLNNTWFVISVLKHCKTSANKTHRNLPVTYQLSKIHKILEKTAYIQDLFQFHYFQGSVMKSLHSNHKSTSVHYILHVTFPPTICSKTKSRQPQDFIIYYQEAVYTIHSGKTVMRYNWELGVKVSRYFWNYYLLYLKSHFALPDSTNFMQ